MIERILKQVEQKLKSNFKFDIFTKYLIYFSYIILIATLLKDNTYLSYSLIFISLPIIAFFILRDLKQKKTDKVYAAKLIDNYLDSENRIISYLSVKEKETKSKFAKHKLELLEKQLEPKLEKINVFEIASLKLSIIRKLLLITLPIVYVLIIYLSGFLNNFLNPKLLSNESILLEQVLKENKNIPKELKIRLNQLSQTLSEEGVSSEKTEEAFAKAEEALEKAKNEIKKQEEKAIPSVTPTPTPTPMDQKNKDQDKQDKQKNKDQKSSDNNKNSKEKQSKDGKKGDKKEQDSGNKKSGKKQSGSESKESEGKDQNKQGGKQGEKKEKF